MENECIFARIQFLVSQPVEDLQAVIAQPLGCINSSSFRHRVATTRALLVYVTTPTDIPEELIWYASVPRLPLRIFRVGSGNARLNSSMMTLYLSILHFVIIGPLPTATHVMTLYLPLAPLCDDPLPHSRPLLWTFSPWAV